MRIISVLILSFVAFFANAEQCRFIFNEAYFIKAMGQKPVKKHKFDNGTKWQYDFRRESRDEKTYEPQFSVTIKNPKCPAYATLYFYEDNNNTESLSNKTLAGRAYNYFTGVDEAILGNKLNRFENVERFESFEDNAQSKFMKISNSYSIDIEFYQ